MLLFLLVELQQVAECPHELFAFLHGFRDRHELLGGTLFIGTRTPLARSGLPVATFASWTGWLLSGSPRFHDWLAFLWRSVS